MHGVTLNYTPSRRSGVVTFLWRPICAYSQRVKHALRNKDLYDCGERQRAKSRHENKCACRGDAPKLIGCWMVFLPGFRDEYAC